MNVFRIAIGRRQEDRWPVFVEYDVDGQPPVSDQGLLKLPEDFAPRLRLLLLDPLGHGALLGQALFHGNALLKFRTALAKSEAAQQLLSVLLAVEAPELMALRWERLCVPDDSDGWLPLSLCQRTPFSILLSSSSDRSFPAMARQELRALLVLAAPPQSNDYELAAFDAQAAADGLTAALGDIPHDILGPAANAVGPSTFSALCQRLADGHASGQPYALLHLVAHGQVRNDQHVVHLLDDDGQVESLTADELVGGLRGLARLPYLAFLSACESGQPTAAAAMGGLAQRLVVDLGLPAVAAMTAPVSIKTATQLASDFYHRLLKHGQPDLALAEAKLGMQGHADVMVPVLFSRKGGWQPFIDVSQHSKAKLPNAGPFSLAWLPRAHGGRMIVDRFADWNYVIRKQLQRRQVLPIVSNRIANACLLGGHERLMREYAAHVGCPFPSAGSSCFEIAQYDAVMQNREAEGDVPLAKDRYLDFVREQFLERNAFSPQVQDYREQQDAFRRGSESFSVMAAHLGHPCFGEAGQDPLLVLADFDLPVYLTTSFHEFLEAALRQAGREPQSALCCWNDDIKPLPEDREKDIFAQDWQPDPLRPLVYHLHGMDRYPESLVLTEDDCLSFLVNASRNRACDGMFKCIEEALNNSSLMLLGYDLRDWDFRTLLHGLIKTREYRRQSVCVLQLDDSGAEQEIMDKEQLYLDSYMKEAAFKVFWGSFEEYMLQLRGGG